MVCNIIISNYAKPKLLKPRILDPKLFLIISLNEIKLKVPPSTKMKYKVTIINTI